MHPVNFNIRTRIDKKTKIQHLILEGDLGVNYIEQIKSKIDSLKIESGDVTVELKKIDSFDLSTFQLLYSLKKTISDKGMSFKIISELPEDIMPVLINTGFGDFFKS
jgi:anti-anti-sigma regulatory factor